jgi:hypothetical protein
MKKRKINYIHDNHGYWYIRYKDPVSKKWKSVSTKLTAIRRNRNEAKEFRNELLAEIDKQVELEYRQGDVNFAFTHFKEINANKSDATKATYQIFYSYLIQKITPETNCYIINKKVAEDFLL